MTILKGVLVVGTLILIALVLVPVVVTQIENHQASENKLILNKLRSAPEKEKSTAIIVFSRSGNTAVLARHLAELQQADFFRLKSPDYDLGLVGWVNAMLDARSGEAQVMPETIDLTQYSRIYLGSPIWLYSPAPPVWQFVENNDFTGKHVVLFNTFNSQFKPEFIDHFKQRVLYRGAISFDHQFVKRGRMGHQLSAEDMLESFGKQHTSK